MNHQLAIFILASTLSFFSSKAQVGDSLSINTLEQVNKSAKDTEILIIPPVTTEISDSIKEFISTDRIITDSTITNQDLPFQDTSSVQRPTQRDSIPSKSTPIIDTTQIKNEVLVDLNNFQNDIINDTIYIQNDSLKDDSISAKPPLLIDTIPIKKELLVDSNNFQKGIVNDTAYIQNDSLQENTTPTIDILKQSSSFSTDSLLLDSIKQQIVEIDTINAQSIIDSLTIQTTLDSISTEKKEGIITIKDSILLELIPDTISYNEPLISFDTLAPPTQNDKFVSIDSLLPIDTNNIIKIDTLKLETNSSTPPLPDTIPVNSIKKNESTGIDSVPVITTPYEKLTGDDLVDSIMNASMIEIQNNHKPKTSKPSATSLESYSVDDLPSEISFVVHAFDSTTKTPIKATVLMTTLDKAGKRNNGTGLCNSAGYFSFFLTPHSHFEITVSFPDYIPIIEEIDFTKTPVFTPIIKKEYALKKFQVGDVIHLKNVNFKQGDFHLQREAFPVLDKLAKLMTENPKMVIKLKGHTDNSGSPSANIKLSESRITEVRYYLLRKGIKLNRLKGEGYGGGHPLVPNNSPENMQKNRRVEFEVLKI